MPYTADQLIAPLGDIEPSMFPKEQGPALEARVGQYLTEGYAKTDIDDAARAWAYYRAYSAVHRRLIAEPQQASLSDQGSRAYSKDQLQQLKDMADEQLATYTRLVTGSTPVAPLPTVVSTSIPNKPVW